MYYSSSPIQSLSNLRLPGLAMSVAILLAGCNVEADTAPIINGPVCEITDLSQGWATCKQGQVLAFLPPSWGNEQLPIIAAALYCDFQHPIVHTNGGVSCVFTGTRKPVGVAEEKTPKAEK